MYKTAAVENLVIKSRVYKSRGPLYESLQISDKSDLLFSKSSIAICDTFQKVSRRRIHCGTMTVSFARSFQPDPSVTHHSLSLALTKRTVGNIILPPTNPVIRLAFADNGQFIFMQTTPAEINAYRKHGREWQHEAILPLPDGEYSTFLGSHLQLAIVGTTQTRVFFADAELGFQDPKIYSLGGNLWAKQTAPVHSVAIQNEHFFCVSMGNNTVVICSISTGSIRKLLCVRNDVIAPIRHLLCTNHFCLGTLQNLAYVWNAYGMDSKPRITLSHGSRVCSVQQLYHRVITGCVDGTIRVWSLLSGQLMRTMNPFQDVKHPLLAMAILPSEDMVLTFITGLYLVKFKESKWTLDSPMFNPCKPINRP